MALHWRRIGREWFIRAQSCRVPDDLPGIGGFRMAHFSPSSRSVRQVTSFTSPLGISHSMRRFTMLRGALPLWLGLICVLLVALAGCGGTSGSGGSNAPVTGGTLNVGLTSHASPRPAQVHRVGRPRGHAQYVRYTGARGRKNTVQPDLATSWNYTSPTQLVFTLRSDVKFQDGTPFNGRRRLQHQPHPSGRVFPAQERALLGQVGGCR